MNGRVFSKIRKFWKKENSREVKEFTQRRDEFITKYNALCKEYNLQIVPEARLQIGAVEQDIEPVTQ